MNITAPSTPPPPLTPEEAARVEESRKFWESMQNRPLVSKELQQRAADEPAASVEDDSEAPLL